MTAATFCPANFLTITAIPMQHKLQLKNESELHDSAARYKLMKLNYVVHIEPCTVSHTAAQTSADNAFHRAHSNSQRLYIFL